MHKLKDIKNEILQQHRQLAFNRRELNLRRWEFRHALHQVVHSRGLLLGSFALGLLLGCLPRTRPTGHGNAPLSRALQAVGRWLTPVKGALWTGLIRTATHYTADRFSGEVHEHYDQRR
jgi:hypothetical protein